MNSTLRFKDCFLACFLLAAYFTCSAQNETVAGEVLTPYPTLTNIAVEWLIGGDDNQNGVVTVVFRKKGSSSWQEGMPLRRVPAGENVNFSWKNKHAGSLFDLFPDTSYEVKLTLRDPDGGNAERTVLVHTRAEPVFDKGEIVELPAGAHDTLRTKSGTSGRPVIYRCPAGTAIYKYIDLRNRQWVYIDGLVVDNIEKDGIGIQMNGAENCAVRRCTINAVYGIVAYKPGAKNCMISDNVVTGVSQWTNKAMGADGDNIGEGIEMTGPGNVICYNRVTAFRDCISTMEDAHVVDQLCIDIYNNDIYRGADDGIEADFCFANCRIYRNRLTNCFVGLSSQPGLGGPNYFIRNVMYNITYSGFKFNRFSQGDVVLHNTLIKIGTGLGRTAPMDYAYFRNNLAIGGPTDGVKWGNYESGNPYASDFINPGSHSSFDYDAVGVWGIQYIAKIGDQDFKVVEPHGVGNIKLDDVFPGVPFPNTPVPERNPPDLRPKKGSAVIDAGIHISNINDGFAGKAPDCGAYELGEEMPHYGPRK
ncbi:MAG TPA: right-handed parallel beta-helix repeat-containing protein [Chryseosolibacter sp.]